MATKAKRKLPGWATPEACECIGAILATIHDQKGYWIRSGDAVLEANNTGYNEGVGAAEQAVVKVLRSRGFSVRADR